MASNRGPRPPKHLRGEAAAFWRRISREYDLLAHDFALLQGACEALQRAQEAREQVEQDGAYHEDRFGQPRAHPALQVERQSREQAEKFIRALCLDGDEPTSGAPRPLARIPSAGGR